LIAWAFGGEHISTSQILGAVAILAGLALTRR
jgi:drug/metabolite transporter (DMT)-like permease